MSITILGTCRNDIMFENNNLNNDINYPHCTKEIIQQIKFLRGEFISQDIEDFRTSILNNKIIELSDSIKQKFNDSKLCIIEISSRKKYEYNNKYLHHLSVDSRFPLTNTKNKQILDNFNIVVQDIEEIKNDIIYISKLLNDKNILWITHIYHDTIKELNPRAYNERKELADSLVKIFKKYNLDYLCPYEHLNNFEFTSILRDDLGHYTEYGKYKWINILENYILNNFF
jgi:hypothetical protein